MATTPKKETDEWRADYKASTWLTIAHNQKEDQGCLWHVDYDEKKLGNERCEREEDGAEKRAKLCNFPAFCHWLLVYWLGRHLWQYYWKIYIKKSLIERRLQKASIRLVILQMNRTQVGTGNGFEKKILRKLQGCSNAKKCYSKEVLMTGFEAMEETLLEQKTWCLALKMHKM